LRLAFVCAATYLGGTVPTIFADTHFLRCRPFPVEDRMDRETRLKRLRFRAWHRGVKEADLLIGGFFDRHGAGWSDTEMDLFEALLEEQDVDIMAWAMGTQPVPECYAGTVMTALKALNYVPISR
jgi:antitoxin CptB